MTESMKATQAEYHYIDAFRVIRGAGKSDAAKAKAVAQFVADEIARHQSQEREAVLDEVLSQHGLVLTDDPDFDHDEQTFEKAKASFVAALTTPAPAVSTDELERLVAHVREGGPHEGRGHVLTRPDGAKARCGGPAFCRECARDLAVLQQVVSRRTAAQPEREAVLESAANVVESRRHSQPDTPFLLAWNQAMDSAAASIRALKTTPAPAVSRDDQALFNDICAKMEEVLKPLPGELSEGDEA